MNICITFADDKYLKSQIKCSKQAYKHGFDKVIKYTPKDIEHNFIGQHRDIFAFERGHGLWLWKPYLIYKTLLYDSADGDFVFYMDSGSFFVKNCSFILKEMKKNNECIYLTEYPISEKCYTKPSLFDYFKLSEENIASAQCQGGFIGIINCESSRNFIKEWLDCCCQLDLIRPLNGEAHDYPFISHREDQSILSCLAKTKGIEFHKNPTQYGLMKGMLFDKTLKPYYRWRHFDDSYSFVIYLHRGNFGNVYMTLRSIIWMFINVLEYYFTKRRGI